MHMNTHQLQLIALNYLQRRRKIAVPDAVLAVLSPGIGFLTVSMPKARVYAEPHAMARRELAQLFQHIDRPGIYRNAQFMHPGERRFINHIGGKDNLIFARYKTCRQRAFNFAKRDGIDLHALLAHQAQNMNIRTCLLGKTHHVKLTQFGNLRANNLRIIDPHRAAEFGRQAQQVVGGQVSVCVVEWAWHGVLRYWLFYDYATAQKE